MKRNQKGFSLMEVLITVGLIGVLTGVAVPSYQKYLRTSKRVEAKTSLSQIYAAEKSFYIQWRFYTSDLVVAGVQPEGRLLYNAGFSSENRVPSSITYHGPSLTGSRNNLYTICGEIFSNSGAGKNCAFSFGNSDIRFRPKTIAQASTASGLAGKPTSSISASAFTALAIAYLLKKPGSSGYSHGPLSKSDIWYITHQRQIGNAIDGTK